jgi:hypothetical protein
MGALSKLNEMARSKRLAPQSLPVKETQEKALKLAQERAALPPSKGGLGLPADNTAQQRAKAMGFDKDVYHGSKQDFDKFKGDQPVFAAEDPDIAGLYGNTIYPLKLRGEELEISDLANGKHGNVAENLAKELGVYDEADAFKNSDNRERELINMLAGKGIDRLKIVDMSDMGGVQTQHAVPAGSDNIRSRFAAFDPFRKDAAIAAAMGVLAPDLLAKETDEHKAKGGVLHMAKAGKVGAAAEGIVGALTKLNEIAKARKAATEVANVDPAVQAVVMAADRAAAGRKASDVAKATSPMKMSEALGNMNLEGKGKLKITQADRTRVGGGNIGGPMFSGLQQVDPIYDQAAWGVGKKSTASAMINDSDPNTLWSTVLGSADQLKSNPIVFNKLRKGFTDSMKQGNLSPELEAKINHNLALTFGEGADIRDPKIWNMANTYEKRGALADLMLGQGIAPGKGGVALGGEKSGKGVIFQPSEILKRETEPMLLHPEHGGDVPTFAVGPRLFNLSGETMTRPDLHPGYPVILKGEDMGVVFEPVAGKEAMPEFVKQYKNVKGREPTGYFDWTKGLVGEGAPTQPITEEYLTYLQKLGKKDGGAMQKPNWHVAVEKHMKDGGYTMVNEKHIPKVRSLKHLAKGGETEGGFASPKELYAALPEFYDKVLKPEVDSYKKPRAVTDLLNRGVVANNPISAVVDMTNLGLFGIDALTGGTRFPTRFASEKPFGGSEHIKDLMKEYGMTTDEERPVAETVLGFLSPGSLAGSTAKGANAIKKAGTAMKDMATSKKARGGLTLMR